MNVRHQLRTLELYFPSLPLLLTFLLFFFMLVKKTMSNRVSKLPPGPSQLPLIGSIHHLLGLLPHHSLRDLAMKHGPLMHLKLGQVTTIIASSPRAAKEIIKTHDLIFANRPETPTTKILSHESTDIVFAPYGGYWGQVRKICTMELLNAKRVKSLCSVREEEVINRVRSITKMIGSPVNLSEKLLTLTNNITCRAAFGGKCQDQEGFIEGMKESLKLAGVFNLDDFFPSFTLIHVISGTKYRLGKIQEKMDKILGDIIEEHKKMKKKGNSEEELADVLLRLHDLKILNLKDYQRNIIFIM